MSLRAAMAAAVAGMVCALPNTAHAIPSPDLVVSSISSVSQLVALLVSSLAGGAMLARRPARNGGPHGGNGGLAWGISGVLLAVSAALAAAAGYLWIEGGRERAERLEATLLRPAHTPGMPRLDPTLEETSFARQLRHPLAIGTGEAEALSSALERRERTDIAILDVRETAETEMGSVPGAQAVRYPDLTASGVDLAGKRALLVCHNGTRSREACEALAARGISCSFIAGGLEKWITERRRTTGVAPSAPAGQPVVASYANQRTLLDTRQVHALVQRDKAILIDVRHPVEFKAGHLPDAISLPMRWLTAETLRARIAELPERPVVLPCYDRVSCRLAEILGLELTRAGRDVRGRYTMPFEYFVAPSRPPYVEQWIAENERGIWSKGVDLAAALIVWLASHVGLPFAIVLLALLSRLAVLPISIKAERDQEKSRSVAGELAGLRDRLRNDPHRLRRAMRAFYRRHDLTPGRNLLALLFLPIMTVTVAGVQQATAQQDHAWLWIGDLAAPDPLYVLPIAFGGLIAGYLHASIARTTRARLVTWAAVMPVMVLAAVVLSAAAGIYLVASAALLLAQRAIAVNGFGRLRTAAAPWLAKLLRPRLPTGAVWLDDVARLAEAGNKARRLGQLRAAGIAAPDGLVLTQSFLDALDRAAPRRRKRDLDRIWRVLGSAPLAVRSSAGAEDGSSNSFAGVFESRLNVDRDTLEAAIAHVAASFCDPRAGTYGSGPGEANVLVQRMVDARFAGVLFTRDPAAAGAVLVELGEGTAEDLVAGATAPQAFRFGRCSKAPMQEARPPIDLAPLLAIGERAERIFGAPQDIEWVYQEGRFAIVQSRDITATFAASERDLAVHGEWVRLTERAAAGKPEARAAVFEQDETAELLPRPTPLSLSMMQRFWAPGGSIDLACRELGLDYAAEEDAEDYLLTIAGRLYVSAQQKRQRHLQARPATLRRILRSSDALAESFYTEFLPDFTRRMTLFEAVEFERMETSALTQATGQICEEFISETHVTVDVINVAAAIYGDEARRTLQSLRLDPAKHLGAPRLSGMGLELIKAASLPAPEQLGVLRAECGHRAALDYELSEPRYGEDEAALEALREFAASRASVKPEKLMPITGSPAADVAVARARLFQMLKEDAKHASLRQLAVLRRAIVALDGKLQLDGLGFWLTMEELLSHGRIGVPELRERASARKQEAEHLATMPPLPARLAIEDLELATLRRQGASGEAGGIGGTRVAGSGMREGRARIVARGDAERGLPIAGFEPGDVIVSSMFHPAWLAHLRHCGGVVTELGGWLSHMALLARELDVAMIVGARGLEEIPDRALLRLHADGTVEILEVSRPAALAAE